MRLALTIVGVTVLALSTSSPAATPTTQAALDRADELLKQLTPEEKLSLVHADSKFTSAGIPRLGIPVRWLSDGPHGVREDIGPYSWDSANHTDDYASAMPASICLAAAFDPELSRRYGETLGEEARARGKDILLGPSVNIHRTPLGGRNFEYMGEDPFLTSRTAVAYIQGLQSRDVACSVKHFALNNQETQRSSIEVKVDERALREIYLPAFEAAVKEGGALTVMGAYNKYLGQHCCHNEVLLNHILKGEWGFKGLVVSDWGGVHDTREAALFGMDLEMGSDTRGRTYDQFFLAKPYLTAIENGELPMSTLDDKARRNLFVMAKTNVFDAKQRAPGALNTKTHQATAREVASAGAVLLKNEKNTLPLDRATLSSVAIIGDFATREQTHGGGSAELKALYEVTPLEGLLKRIGESANVTVAQGYKVVVPPRPTTRATQPSTTQSATTRAGFDNAGMRTDVAPADDITMRPNEALIARAVEAARNADVVIIIAGNGHERRFDTEGSDRRDMRLPYGQDELIRRVAEVNPKTIVVLLNGQAVDMPWLEQVPAVLEMWYGGMEGGNAMADVLLGDVNPSGKLPFTWPKKLSDSPAHALDAYPGRDGVVEYKEGLLVGYRWFDEKKIEPLFSFGHGLSYTTFECKDLVVTPGRDAAGLPTAELTCDVTNTGTRTGAEVVQAYVHDSDSSLPRPPQELKGYAKVSLAPGETKRVTISLPTRSFAFWDSAAKAWTAEAGNFEVRVGFGSRDIRQTVTFELPQTVRVE